MDLKELIRDMSVSHAEMMKSGIRFGEQQIHPALRVLEREYRGALSDRAVAMPGPLRDALEAVLNFLPKAH